MPVPDILLDDSETTVVGRLQLVTEEGGEPTVTVNPNTEGLEFGQVAENETRTEMSPELVETDEIRSLELGLGGGQTYQQEGRCRIYRGGDQDLQPKPGVDINGGGKTQTGGWAAGITIWDEDSRGVEISPDSIDVPTGLQVGTTRGTGGGDPDGPPPKKGSDRPEPEVEFLPGQIDVKGDFGAEGEADTAVAIRGASENRPGPSLSVSNTVGLTTADVDGEAGRLTLGRNLIDIPDLPDDVTGGLPGTGGSTLDGNTESVGSDSEGAVGSTQQTGSPRVGGKITLLDGNQSQFDITADSGTLSIDVAGEGTVFEIDAANEQIRTKWEVTQDL